MLLILQILFKYAFYVKLNQCLNLNQLNITMDVFSENNYISIEQDTYVSMPITTLPPSFPTSIVPFLCRNKFVHISQKEANTYTHTTHPNLLWYKT